MTPEVPYYSATLFDPRERPVCDAGYWVDNLRYTVRFAAAVQAALEDGYRVFAELAPHPLLTHAVEQTAAQPRHAGWPRWPACAASRSCRTGCAAWWPICTARAPRWTSPCCTRAGGWWTRRCRPGLTVALLLSRGGRTRRHAAAARVSCIRCLGAHVRLPEEPERHVWQAEVGTAAHAMARRPPDHNVAALPGAAYCEMALAAARAVLGEASEVRDIRFEQMLLLDDETPVGAVGRGRVARRRRVRGGDRSGRRTRRGGPARSCTRRGRRAAACARHGRAAGGPPGPRGRRRAAKAVRRAWHPVRSGVHGPGRRAHRRREQPTPCWPRSRCPRAIRSQQAAYGVHPALLDACFQSVAAHPEVQARRGGGCSLPLGVRRLRAYGPTRNARYCYTRVTKVDACRGRGRPRCARRARHGAADACTGCRFGTGVSESGNSDRVLNERLLTIEWQQRELPEVERTDAGAWLLVSTSATADAVATSLTDALKAMARKPRPSCWPPHADHGSSAEQLAKSPAAPMASPVVVVLTGPDEPQRRRPLPAFGAASTVQHLVRIARELPEVPGELAPPVRRDPERPDRSGRRRAPTWSRPGCAA